MTSELRARNNADLKRNHGYGAVDEYAAQWEKSDSQSNSTDRKQNYQTLVNTYYDLATDFYEWGWGTSFHFAPRRIGETVDASIARHEHFLALRLGLKPGMRVLDVGCGVGGPMMEIARFSGATIVGINNNGYQVTRGEKHVKAAGLTKLCSFVKGDFMQLPFEDSSFDSVYAIEAICHAPDKIGIYKELLRVLKPGGKFACYEWCLTDKYDPNNAEDRMMKENVEVGDGLPDIDTTRQALDYLKASNFILLEQQDLAPTTEINPIPWYDPFLSNYTSFKGLSTTPLAITAIHTTLNVLEKVFLLTKGTTKTHEVLMRARSGLVKGGEDQTFTPMFYFLAQKSN